MLRISGPPAAGVSPEREAAQAAVQIEAVSEIEHPEPTTQLGERSQRIPPDDGRQVRIMGQEWSKRRPRHHGDPRLGMPAAESAHQGGEEKDVTDGAEADEEDIRRHAGNVAA